jgi:hypothetical protein
VIGCAAQSGCTCNDSAPTTQRFTDLGYDYNVASFVAELRQRKRNFTLPWHASWLCQPHRRHPDRPQIAFAYRVRIYRVLLRQAQPPPSDPLAPLLFVCLGDVLHDGLNVHPVSNIRHGCMIISRARSMMTYLASLGYADDIAVSASTFAALRKQNDCIKCFMLFNHMRLSRRYAAAV